METKLIKLDDGILVEVFAEPDKQVPLSGNFAEKIKEATMEKAFPILKGISLLSKTI